MVVVPLEAASFQGGLKRAGTKRCCGGPQILRDRGRFLHQAQTSGSASRSPALEPRGRQGRAGRASRVNRHPRGNGLTQRACAAARRPNTGTSISVAGSLASARLLPLHFGYYLPRFPKGQRTETLGMGLGLPGPLAGGVSVGARAMRLQAAPEIRAGALSLRARAWGRCVGASGVPQQRLCGPAVSHFPCEVPQPGPEKGKA